MEELAQKKSSFVNVMAWLMMGFGAFGFMIGSFQLFFFKFVLGDAFVDEMTSTSGLFIEDYANLFFQNIPLILGFFLMGYALQIVVGLGLWKRMSWAWMASIAVFSVILLGTIGIGVFQQIFYSIMFAEVPEPNLDNAVFSSMQLSVRLIAGFMMILFSCLWAWIIYRLSRPEIRAEFV